MTTPLSVPGTLHANPTDTYFQEAASPSTMNPQSSNHDPQVLTNHCHPMNSNSPRIPENPHHPGGGGGGGPPQQTQPTLMNIGSTQSLNPAAPQFVPLPTYISSSPAVGGGYYQSTPMYVMGSQQMVYSQCNSGIGGSTGFNHVKQNQAPVASPSDASPSDAATNSSLSQTSISRNA